MRFGDLPDKRLNAPAASCRTGASCAPRRPTWKAIRNAQNALADLAEHRCIIHRQNDDAYGIWRFHAPRTNSEVVKVHGMLSSNDGDIVLGWALGWARHPDPLRVGPGQVPRQRSGCAWCLPEFKLPSADLYAYYPERRNLPIRAQAFIDFLAEHFKAAVGNRGSPVQEHIKPRSRSCKAQP
jgi:LysR family transcriptional activator of dmlA